MKGRSNSEATSRRMWMLSASSKRRWLRRGKADALAGGDERDRDSAAGMHDLFQCGDRTEGQCKKRTRGLFSSGVSPDELRMGDQRLVHAPVEDLRQATTRAALRGAIHV